MLELPEKDHIINRARDHKREQSSSSERSSQNTLAALVVQMINLDISLVILLSNLIRDLKACSVVCSEAQLISATASKKLAFPCFVVH